MTMGARGGSNGSRAHYRSNTERWYPGSVTVEVRGNNDVAIIMPCGETRVFEASGVEWLIRELEDALRECKV